MPETLAAPRSAAERRALEGELAELYRSWRILDLVGETAATLSPAWLQILDVARHLLGGIDLPGLGGEIPDSLARLIRPPRQEYTTVLRSQRKRRVVYPVTGDTAVRALRHMSDLPQVTLPDLMLRTLSPEIFDYLLISGGIGALYNIELGPATEEYDAIVEEQVPLPPRGKRQKVYALLDVSNSMRDFNKAIFAKALMLAYLVTAAEEDARLYFRTFGNTIHARTDCLDASGFPALARRILSVTPDGSTDIRGAIGTAIGDIRELDELNTFEGLFEQPPTEILLISDCESYSVPFIPKGVKLHTVHLKGGRMMTAYREGFETIRAASATFTELDTTDFTLPDAARERWLLLQDGLSLEANGAGGPDRDTALKPEDAVRRKEVFAAYERMSQTSGKRAVAKLKMSGMNFMPRLGRMPRIQWFGVLRLLGEAILRFLHRGSPPGTIPSSALGTNVRVRR